ncbi:hypothetical protein LS73_000175 [Helicobacter muridarum]|uniref:Phage protein n=1 Tax=Helicobacter muridarum TaxID=216 RepID=A0A099TYP0_9HELI|nr:hypothetical protein [Helicobacter muridarum]TLE01599.1 hypothetical protein LS73_000175 [Helicobacter muridarum]STQ86213.1 Uncharacterised protein [Helicobacter muridarum]
MANLVFKVERASIDFSAELSNGESVTLTLFETNTRQLQELTKAKELDSNIDITLKQLRENLSGQRKEDFIQDLLEHGSIDSFYVTMSEQFRKIKEAKRKN